MIHRNYSSFHLRDKFLGCSVTEQSRVGGPESLPDNSVEGKDIFESGYPTINHRAGYPDHDSGPELECGSVWVKDCRFGIGIA